jgi:hypothetical protein
VPAREATIVGSANSINHVPIADPMGYFTFGRKSIFHG